MVKLFTSPSCQQCNATKRALVSADIEFVEVDMSVDESALNYVKNRGFRSAPVVITENDAWSGFRPEKISALVVA